MLARLLLATSLLVALPAAPAAAASLTPLKACYVSNGEETDQREDVVVEGDGFAASAAVDIYVDGLPAATVPTDPVGVFKAWVDAPYQPQAERPFTVTVTDGVNVLSLESRVTNLNVIMRPRRSPPNRRVRLRGRGFTRAAPVYAHYVYGGRERRTVRLARRPRGRCGRFAVRRRQIPIDDPRTGRWVVQFDQKRAWAPEPDPVWVRLPIRVVEVFREP